jgi:hypothetical protein
MNVLELVDDLYAEFASSLEGELAEHARDLPRALRLAPVRNAAWSSVFAHEVTLGAPALFAQAMPSVSVRIVRDATLAHMLAVIDAFGTDRIEDSQIPASPSVRRILERVRQARDTAWRRISRDYAFGESIVDPSAADWVTAHAISTERVLLTSLEPVGFHTYESVALAKQSAGLVASVALARAAGWSPRRCLAARRTLESIAVGLQMHDDVVDWEDDQMRGGSWVAALLRSTPEASEQTQAERLGARVLSSGVLAVLLRRARWHMRAAATRAETLGAKRLATWAREREEQLSTLVQAETRSPGYTIRARALSAWAAEVLA